MHESTPTPLVAYPRRKSLRTTERRSGRYAAATAAPEVSPIALVTSLSLPENSPRLAESARPLPRSRTPRRSFRRLILSTSAVLGAASLVLTFAASGLANPGIVETPAALAQQQHLGTDASLVDAYDLLGEVAAETAPADVTATFTNFADAGVQYPFASPVLLTDGFGERAFPVAGFHDAQDFAAPLGTPIQAIADGTVVEAGWADDGCGFGLKLEHRIDGQDVTSRYCHMWADSHTFTVGDEISVGQEVGRVGATGIAFGAHLHFVITVEGEAVDPMPFLLKYNRSTRR